MADSVPCNRNRSIEEFKTANGQYLVNDDTKQVYELGQHLAAQLMIDCENVSVLQQELYAQMRSSGILNGMIDSVEYSNKIAWDINNTIGLKNLRFVTESDDSLNDLRDYVLIGTRYLDPENKSQIGKRLGELYPPTTFIENTMKLTGLLFMVIALMLAVYTGTESWSYVAHGGLYGASATSIMLFVLAVFLGGLLAMTLAKVGYQFFTEKN